MQKNKGILILLLLCFFTQLYFAQEINPFAPETNPEINQCISVVNQVETSGNIIGQLTNDTIGQLPIGIAKRVGPSQVIIAIDSAMFLPNKAMFNAYAAIDFPGSFEKIAFRARDVEFNPKGIIGGDLAKLLLVSNHRIRINPNVTLVLKSGDNNYIKWNCNGFEKIHLKGYFEFSRNIILPDTSEFNVVNGDKNVTASFEFETNDLNNFITQISISPFYLKGIKDFSFSVQDATVDMSSVSNFSGMSFPQNYDFNGNDLLMWQGFYLKQLKVKLPKALSQKNQARKEIIVQDFIIDNSGVSGKFIVTNVLGNKEGDMSGWGFSIHQMNVNITQNHINGAGFSGEVEIPISDQTQFNYSAQISQNSTTNSLDYQFSISPKNNIDANVLSSSINLYNTSVIFVKTVNDQFLPEAKLSGEIKFNNENFKTSALKFENIHIVSKKPIFIGGTFALTNIQEKDSSSKAGGFNISINTIAFQFANNEPPSLYVNVGLQFIQEKDGGGLGAQCGILLKTKYKDNYLSSGVVAQTDKLTLDKVQLTDIALDVETQAFGIKGYVVFMNNDPTFGKGFLGGVKLNVKSAGIFVDINAAFGAKNTYKYFYVDGAVKLPTAIPLCYALGMYGFKGGLYYHMRPIITAPLKDGMVSLMQSSQSVLASQKIPYTPDSTSSMGLKAGIMFGLMGKDDILNGDVGIEIQFNQNGGLDLIRLKGDIALLCSINDKMSKPSSQLPISGTTDMYYDFVNQVFHMNSTVNFKIQNILNGSGQSVIHYEASKWYVYVGKPSSRVNINIYDIVNINSYFMVGTEVEPMPAPPSYVNVAYNDGRNTQMLSSGNGVVAGAAFAIDIDEQFGFDFFKVYYWLHGGAGFDMMLGKYKLPYRCEGYSEPPGFKGWFGQGQVWTYINGGVGVKGEVKISEVKKPFDFTIASINIAAILTGKAPNPIYLEGAIHASYNILEVATGSINFNFKEGKNCNIIQ